MNWYELTQLIAPTVIVLTALGYMWRQKIVPFMVDQMAGLVEQRTAAAIVKKELTMNGGGSVKDLVARIGPNHAEAQRRLLAIESRLDAGDKRFDEIDATLKERLP